jgi:hypothetical protein
MDFLRGKSRLLEPILVSARIRTHRLTLQAVPMRRLDWWQTPRRSRG